jgi:hypothetical protein
MTVLFSSLKKTGCNFSTIAFIDTKCMLCPEVRKLRNKIHVGYYHRCQPCNKTSDICDKSRCGKKTRMSTHWLEFVSIHSAVVRIKRQQKHTDAGIWQCVTNSAARRLPDLVSRYENQFKKLQGVSLRNEITYADFRHVSNICLWMLIIRL